MKRLVLIALVALVSGLFTSNEVWSRGRGGGMRGGGGVSRGNFGGGARTPSMSRPQARPASRPQISRPNISSGTPRRPNNSRPNAGLPSPNRPSASRPNVIRPNTGGNRPNIGTSRPNLGTNRPGNLRPGGTDRPSAGDLNDFLNLPGGNRPTTLPGQVGRPSTGKRPGVGNRPGVGDRPNLSNRPNIGKRPNVGNRPNIGNRTNIGNKPNMSVGNNNRVNINRQRNVNSIRNHWSNVGRRPFGRDWWSRYPSTLPGWRWHGGWGRYPESWYWRHGTWAALGGWFAWNWAEPVVYNYGSNVVYRDNYVYVNDQQVASSEQYYQQAETIAASIPDNIEVAQVEWMPLGVYAIAEEDGVDNGMLIQLAVSKEGLIAGTFYNDSTDEGRPLEGYVDRETQRAAWKFADGKNSEIVMETAINNLTQEESTALVHFGAEQNQTWLMVRLPEENEEN